MPMYLAILVLLLSPFAKELKSVSKSVSEYIDITLAGWGLGK